MQHQPGSVAIDQEAASRRTLRRLSASQGHGSVPLDPDLPIPRVPNGHAAPPHDTSPVLSDAADGSTEDASSESSHVFWVPARLHPELAPAEFRAFLAEHTTSSPSASPPDPLARSLSRGNSLGRQKSMLSRQYRPSANDGVDMDPVAGSSYAQRNANVRRSGSQTAPPSLSAADLQTLEALADEAAKSGDASRLRSVLKRSISMNHTSVIDQMDDIQGDDVDEPIFTPQPSQSLKRTARTKIRKNNLQGTGGGHRFAATRRGKVFQAAPDHFIPSDSSNAPPHDQIEPPRATFTEPDETPGGRPLSYSEESAIYDSYADRASLDQDEPSVEYESSFTTAPPSIVEPTISGLSAYDPRDARPASAPPSMPSPPPQQPQQPMLHQPTPRQQQPPTLLTPAAPARSPSPSSVSDSYIDPSPIAPGAGRRPQAEKPKDKDKKGGLFGKGKNKKEKAKDAERASAREKEKDSSFFGSLFGGKKKSDEGNQIGTGHGPAAAAALMGQSKPKASPVSVTPEPLGPKGYARYPIHVERAVYRLSHIKLANPRRPLQEQVLISNLMFWYLGVINKPVAPQQPAAQPQANPAQDVPAGGANPEREEQERMERERVEREQQAAVAAEREREEAIRREQQQQQQQQSPRKGLNKSTGAGGDPRTGARRAEMPVKSPQYGMGMVMEQGGGYDAQDPHQRHPNAGYPPSGPEPYHQDLAQQPVNEQAYRQRSPPPRGQPQYQEPPQYPIYNLPPEQQPSPRNTALSPPPITRQPPRSSPSSLPPGAMPPVSDPSHSWVAQSQQMGQPSPAGGRPPNPRTGSSVSLDYDQYYQADQQSNRGGYPMDRRADAPPDGRQPRSPPPQARSPPPQPQSPPQGSTRRPSYNASNVPRAMSPPDDGAKLQGRSRSASAIPSDRESRAQSPPDPSRPRVRSRSRTREDVPLASQSPPPALPPINGGVRVVRQDDWRADNREDEDLPLAMYQRQQSPPQPQHHAHPAQHHHHHHPQQYQQSQVPPSQDYQRGSVRR